MDKRRISTTRNLPGWPQLGWIRQTTGNLPAAELRERGTVKIGMVGTRGVPAQYGGFETAVEEIGARLVKSGHEVVVYCRNPGQTQREHLGMQLVNLPALRKKSLETLSHTGLSLLHTILRDRPDVVALFNAANAPFLPLLRAARIPTAVHLDGLEWKRAKWRGLGQRYYMAAERWSVRLADEVIADARGIADHVSTTYGRESVFIPYGAPVIEPGSDRLGELGVKSREFHLVVARFEPENHVDVIVEGYVRSRARKPLLVVGSAPYADAHTREIHALGRGDPRVRFLGAVWDQRLLDQLYGNCLSYLHGHSVGGTNPSLLRAMGAGAPVIAYDVVFNREVIENYGTFFRHSEDVRSSIEEHDRDVDTFFSLAERGREHVANTYSWESVTLAFERLSQSLIASRGRR